jgi:Domain of unknown function (DUF4412)
MLSFLLCAAVSASAQDLTITSKVSQNGAAPETSTSYITADRLRTAQADGNDVLFDLKSGDVTVLDATEKTYYVITRKDIDDITATIKEQMNSPEMKKAQEQMKNLPPDMQKKMQGMMGGAMGGAMAVDVQKSGQTRTIAGYKCENWTISIGQMTQMKECVTTDLKFPAAAWEGFKNYADNMKAMMSAMGPMASGFDKMREELQKVKGFPLATTQTTNVMGTKSTSTTEVTGISHGPIPASAWVVPAGYKQVDNPMKQAMQRH